MGWQGQGEDGRRPCVKVTPACGHMACTETWCVRAADTGLVGLSEEGYTHLKVERAGQAEETSLPFKTPGDQKSGMVVSKMDKEMLSGKLLPTPSRSSQFMGSSSWYMVECPAPRP